MIWAALNIPPFRHRFSNPGWDMASAEGRDDSSRDDLEAVPQDGQFAQQLPTAEIIVFDLNAYFKDEDDETNEDDKKRFRSLHWSVYRINLSDMFRGLSPCTEDEFDDTTLDELGCQTGNPSRDTGTNPITPSPIRKWDAKKTAIAATTCLAITMVPLAAAQYHVPGAVLHTAIGTSVTSSVVVPVLRNIGDRVPLECIITAYAIWVSGFIAQLVCELLRRPDSLERRLLGGSVLFAALNLLGTLGQSTPSTLEGICNWGPLALTVSLLVVPTLMELVGIREFARWFAGFFGFRPPVGGGDGNNP